MNRLKQITSIITALLLSLAFSSEVSGQGTYKPKKNNTTTQESKTSKPKRPSQRNKPNSGKENKPTKQVDDPAETGIEFDISDIVTESFEVNGVPFEMVKVEGGSFMMGSKNGDKREKPVHRETVSTFYIGKTEVTQALWKAVMGENPSWFKGNNLPVENVSWSDCQDFIKRLNSLTGKRFRLPTEAEWEYAARGGNRSHGFTFSGSEKIDSVAWYCADTNGGTHPVGQKYYNELGIYDMSGNVGEWTSDFGSNNYSSPRDSEHPVIRGGGWSDCVPYCRVTDRFVFFSPKNSHNNVGLRLAL